MTNSSRPDMNGQITHVRSTRGVRQYALAGILFGTVFPIVATAIRLAQGHYSLNLANIAAVQRADPLLWIIDTAPLFLGLLATLAGIRQDALTERNWQLLQREQQLTEIQSTLELRVQERTQDLEERNREMRDAVLVTRRVSRIGQAPELVATSAQAVADMVGGYQVDVHLLDATGTFATLVASSSGADAQSINLDRRTRVGDPSIVGRVAASGRSVVIQSGGADQDGTAVPGTMALPLVVRGRVIGVLGLRPESRMTDRHTPNAELLQLVADQLAATIDSSRLFDETRVALEQLQRISGQGTQEAWREFLSRRHVVLQYTPAGTMPVSKGIGIDDPESVRAPLTVRGQQIGSIALRRDASMPWTDGERELALKVAAQVASALENVRLLEDSVQRANKERRLSEITAKIGASINMRNVLQTAAEELGRALPGSDVTLKLGRTATDEREETQP
jgi:GAF domain-containing protein